MGLWFDQQIIDCEPAGSAPISLVQPIHNAATLTAARFDAMKRYELTPVLPGPDAERQRKAEDKAKCQRKTCQTDHQHEEAKISYWSNLSGFLLFLLPQLLFLLLFLLHLQPLLPS
jgi:hypothetical protein